MNALPLNRALAVACLFIFSLSFGLGCRKENPSPIENFNTNNQFIGEANLAKWLKDNPLSKILKPNWGKARQAHYQGKNIVRVPILNVNELGKLSDYVNPGYNSKHPPELFFIQNANRQLAGYLINFIPKEINRTGGENGIWTGQLVEWNCKGDTLHIIDVDQNKEVNQKLIAPVGNETDGSLKAVLRNNKLALTQGDNGTGGFWSFLGRVLGAIADFLGLPTRETYVDGPRINWGQIVRNISDWFDGAESYTGGGDYLSAGGPIYVSYLNNNYIPSGATSGDVSNLVYTAYVVHHGGPLNELPLTYGLEMLGYLNLSPAAQSFIVTDAAIPLTDALKMYLDKNGNTPDNLAFASWAVEYFTQSNTDLTLDEFSLKYGLKEYVIQAYDGVEISDPPVETPEQSYPIIGSNTNRGNTEDMTYGTDHDISGIRPDILSRDVSSLFFSMENLIDFATFRDQSMRTTAHAFVDQFRNNNSTSFEMTNATLNMKAQNSPEMKGFFIKIGDAIRSKLLTNGGNINTVNFDLGRVRPIFGGLSNMANGLTILLNDTEYSEVKLESYSRIGNIATIVVNVNVYDHFGLDKNDAISKQEYHDGFQSWWVLQHRKNYKPFITRVNTRQTIIIRL